MTITFFNWKMKAKFNQILLEMFAPLTSFTCPRCLLFQSLVFRSPLLISNQDCSTHCNVLGFISYHMFVGHRHRISDETLIIFLLFTAPLTFLSGAWKNMHSYCCWGETKFNFWVGNRRIIHEQISSKWYDLLNFGLWFIFMYSCYC